MVNTFPDFYTENLSALQDRGFLQKLGIFPTSRGFVDGVLKGYGGLSDAILTEIYNIFLRNSSSKYLLFLAFGTPAIGLSVMFLVRPCTLATSDDPAKPYHFSLVVPLNMTLFPRNGTKLEQQVGSSEFLIQRKDESATLLLASSSTGALKSFNDRDDLPEVAKLLALGEGTRKKKGFLMKMKRMMIPKNKFQF
ncbi:hypothetical protein LR48_Vigan02g099300 [Vigna angularis]|uniref:Nodulin-like domain-containing protein n=2 Tax=Phaseolus angularis TaxID=3914 RepID=A0A0L9TW80_PHAAN|nr:hypothetical protein LR48_Vigan02g099300 [Vigna angularis]BAT95778.1 hypothetical protein VIGAN_08258200 [Vigna angularis var. angularis]